jgi:hypothetical protein
MGDESLKDSDEWWQCGDQERKPLVVYLILALLNVSQKI